MTAISVVIAGTYKAYKKGREETKHENDKKTTNVKSGSGDLQDDKKDNESDEEEETRAERSGLS